MKLRSLLPTAFGRFHAKEPIVLKDGLNIISGDNESGKTTLGAFISGMFTVSRKRVGPEYPGPLNSSDTGRGQARSTEVLLCMRTVDGFTV